MTPDDIHILMPTSPTPIHPSIAHIQETIASVRYHLPNSMIHLMIDGVRDEQQSHYDNYQEYIRRLLIWANHSDHNICPHLFPQFTHQARMTRHTLNHIDAPKPILFVEHDTPLLREFIDWPRLVDALETGSAFVIRFHHETHILPPHEHMMLDRDPTLITTDCYGYRTAQWSQRPHLSTSHFYHTLLQKYFHPDSRTMIEDVLHGSLHSAWLDYGPQEWADAWKVWIYAPTDTPHIKRSTHLDSRGSDTKYDMEILPL